MAKNLAPSPIHTFEVLADNLGILGDRFRNNVAVMAKKAGVVVVEEAAVRTPVDTSEARSNWTLETSRVTVVRPPYVSGKRHLGIGERAALASVVGAAKRSARSITTDHVCAGRPIYVSNPTPHIGLLNAGFSRQNPEGNFDAIAIQLAQGYIGSYIRTGQLLTKFDAV